MTAPTFSPYRKGWDEGYDAGYAAATQNPMTFCVCTPGERCKFVEDVADGHAETCWYCTFLDGETPCPVEPNAPHADDCTDPDGGSFCTCWKSDPRGQR